MIWVIDCTPNAIGGHSRLKMHACTPTRLPSWGGASVPATVGSVNSLSPSGCWCEGQLTGSSPPREGRLDHSILREMTG